MNTIHKAGIVCCSNGRTPDFAAQLHQLQTVFSKCGIESFPGQFLYQANGPASGSPQQRAHQLQRFFQDPSMDAVFDISGGDLANELLDFLDYDQLRSSKAIFWGYSDLTCILNALYTQTEKPGVLYSVCNLTRSCSEEQIQRIQSLQNGSLDPLFSLPVHFLQGQTMAGTLVGGNIRCFLKLAGTAYFPDLSGKVLLLEAMSGSTDRICAFLSQLRQLGAFEQINGLLLGTFSQLDKELGPEAVEKLVLERVSKELPVARTAMIGHGASSMAALIGGRYEIKNDFAQLQL